MIGTGARNVMYCTVLCLSGKQQVDKCVLRESS